MNKFIRSIGKTYVNSIGFDLYETEDGAVIKPTFSGKGTVLKNKWVKFDSVEQAEKFIEKIGQGTSGAQLVHNLKQHIL